MSEIAKFMAQKRPSILINKIGESVVFLNVWNRLR